MVTKREAKINLKIGEQFGRLVIIENIGTIKGKTHFNCQCKCGNIKPIAGTYLRSGRIKSCGCLGIENRIKHNMARTQEYQAWQNMIQRCTNSNNPGYKNYGGRGITVCAEWLSSFINFFKDMGKRPIGLTIERINNDLGYFKDNCCWATVADQNRNHRIPKNKTGITGVCWFKKCQKYRVRIGANRKDHHIGVFKNLEDAKAARIAAEQKYW